MSEIKRLILAIETTQEGGSVSLLEDGREIDFLIGKEKVSRSEVFLEMVQEIFKRNSNGKEISLIGVSKGPGSQTGIRSGLATAKGLSDAFGVDYYSIDLLDAMCELDADNSSLVLTALSVGRGKVCYSIFQNREFKRKQIVVESKMCILSDFEILLREFTVNVEKRVVLSGEIGRILREEIDLNCSNISLVDGNLAKLVGIAAYSRWQYLFS